MKELGVTTSRRIEMKEITREVQRIVEGSGVTDGVCTVYCPHTTAGLAINENADPSVCSDLERAFKKAVPEVPFEHAEGNSPAHFLSCITGSSVTLLVRESKILLGTWQGVFFCEFDGPRQRRVWIRVGSAST